MSVESGCLGFCSSRGDGCSYSLECLHSFSSIAWFFCSDWFFVLVFYIFFLARCHSVMAAFNLCYFNLIARRT